MSKILFINTSRIQCGVHQYGLNLFKCMAKSDKFDFAYLEAPNLESAIAVYDSFKPDIVICNYHSGASHFLNPDQPRAFNGSKNICILHEGLSESYSRGFYDMFIFGDPNWSSANDFKIAIPRFLYPYENKIPEPEIPTFGTFGFSFPGKDYNRFLDTIQSQYDRAIIKIHSPQNDVMIHDHHRSMLASVMDRKNSGIEVQFSRDFLDRDGVLNFLASNTANVFIYDKSNYLDGISSVIDYALSAKRPIVVNKCNLFRHILHLPVAIEDHDLKSILAQGTTIFNDLYEQWSEPNNIKFYEDLFTKLLGK